MYTCVIYHIFYPLKSSFRKGLIFLHVDVFLLMMSTLLYSAKQSGAGSWNTNTMSPGTRQVTKMGEIVACTPHIEIGRPWWAFYLQNLTTNFSFLENPWGQLRPSRPLFAISEIIVCKAVPSTGGKYTIPKPSRGAKMHIKPEKSENKSRYHLWTGGLPQAWIIYKMIIPVLLTSPTDFLFLH